MNWKVGTHDRDSDTCEKGEEHELVIDSGCYGHVCPPWFAPQFILVSSSNVEAVAANDGALRHHRVRGVRTRDDEQWQTSFDTDHT